MTEPIKTSLHRVQELVSLNGQIESDTMMIQAYEGRLDIAEAERLRNELRTLAMHAGSIIANLDYPVYTPGVPKPGSIKKEKAIILAVLDYKPARHLLSRKRREEYSFEKDKFINVYHYPHSIGPASILLLTESGRLVNRLGNLKMQIMAENARPYYPKFPSDFSMEIKLGFQDLKPRFQAFEDSPVLPSSRYDETLAVLARHIERAHKVMTQKADSLRQSMQSARLPTLG